MEMARDLNLGTPSDRGGILQWASQGEGLRPLPTSTSETRTCLAAMRDAWRRADWNEVIIQADALLKMWPGHTDALKMRLKAAINAGRLDIAAEAAIAAAEEHPLPAFIAAKKLISGRQPEAAAHVLIALRQTGSGTALDGWDDITAKAAANLVKLAGQARSAGDGEGYRQLLGLGVAVTPENAALRKRADTLRAETVEQAKRVDFEKDPQEFVAAWERVLKVDPKHVTAIKRLATAAEKSDDAGRAMEFWARLLDVDLTNTVAAQRLARAASRSGREHEGLVTLYDAGLAAPGSEHIARLTHKVRSACKLAVRGGDDLTAAHHLVLLLQVEQGDEELEVLRRKVLSLLNKELSAFRKAEQPGSAAAVAARLLQLDPHNVPALTAVARYLYQSRDFAEAANYYQRLTDATPDSAVNWLHLARARHRAGDLRGASNAVAQSRSLAPDNSASENLDRLLKSKLPG